LIFGARASAQSAAAPNAKPGSILGTVVDSDHETIPNATVLLRYKSWIPESLRRTKERFWNWVGL